MRQNELTDYKPAKISYKTPEVGLIGMVRVNEFWCVNNRVDLSVPDTAVWYLVTIESMEENKPVKVITNKEIFYKCAKITSTWGNDHIYAAANGEQIPSYITKIALEAIAIFDQGVNS